MKIRTIYWNGREHPPVIYNGVAVTHLNADLIRFKMLTTEEVEVLVRSHVLKYALHETIRNTEDPKRLAHLGDMYTTLLFFQQDVWGFERSESRHNWMELPKCRCRCGDFSRKTTPNINRNCPLHAHRIF